MLDLYEVSTWRGAGEPCVVCDVQKHAARNQFRYQYLHQSFMFHQIHCIKQRVLGSPQCNGALCSRSTRQSCFKLCQQEYLSHSTCQDTWIAATWCSAPACRLRELTINTHDGHWLDSNRGTSIPWRTETHQALSIIGLLRWVYPDWRAFTPELIYDALPNSLQEFRLYDGDVSIIVLLCQTRALTRSLSARKGQLRSTSTWVWYIHLPNSVSWMFESGSHTVVFRDHLTSQPGRQMFVGEVHESQCITTFRRECLLHCDAGNYVSCVTVHRYW